MVFMMQFQDVELLMLKCRQGDSVTKKTEFSWNMGIRSMNMVKLNVVRTEMNQLHIENLGIRELKWSGIGNFHSENHTAY